LCRDWLLKLLIEGNVEGTGRQGGRGKQLLDGSKETKRYWKLKEEALDGTVWRIGFGRDCGVHDTRLQTQESESSSAPRTVNGPHVHPTA